ncbi:phosphoethanolamine transferase, partial [Pseudomonas aeruginosa]|nr:phosphoethanolamine transferase [Pseudomonas aeruginosa]
TQKHVPMALWLSADYQQRYGISANCLQQRAQKENYSQDNLFSTLLGLLGVSTREYQAADDILTPCREAG